MAALYRTAAEFPIEIPLTASDRQQARQWSQKHSPPVRARVYRNTLAVLALKTYCRYLGVPATLDGCDSSDPVARTLEDAADLKLLEFGRVECRAVPPGADVVALPSDLRGDRAGYVAVELSESGRQARLLGFALPAAAPVSEPAVLQPLPDLFEALERAIATGADPAPAPARKSGASPQAADQPDRKPTAPASATAVGTETGPTRLGLWLAGQFAAGWEALETWFSPDDLALAWAFRNPAEATTLVRRAKQVDLETCDGCALAVLSLRPLPGDEWEVAIALQARDREAALPRDLQIVLTDEAGKPAMQTTAGGSATVELQFTARTGEAFSIAVDLKGRKILEEKFCV